ncbi:MAG: TonB-dependent receptor [Verrucomicrobiota bacterium]
MVVSSWDATPLAGVSVTLRGTTLATQADPSGRFELKNVPPGNQVLRFSKSGYASAAVTDVRVLPGQTTTVNGNLRPEFYEMEEYEVTAEELTQQTEKILFERQKAVGMTDSLGSDFLSRVGAGNAAESISKVSGATIVEGKFAVIRGLNDRYVSTTLNGANIPSADPYRQSASLDLFPSQVIDRVVVAKTFTPDQPGTFTGGGIDVITKSFPDKPFLTASIGTAYNTQSSLNERFLTHSGGNTDWAGMDDGTRALPAELQGAAVPNSVPGLIGKPGSEIFLRDYPRGLELDRQTKALGTTEFAPTRTTAPLDHNFSMAGGGSKPLFGGPFGYFVGVSYKHDYSFYEDGIYRRYWQGTNTKSDYRDSRSLSVVNWAGMVNLAYQPFENHELGFTFLYNQNGTDESRRLDQGFEDNDRSKTFRRSILYYTERNLNTFQMKGEHRFPALADLKFNWLVALTQTSQGEPDARFFNDSKLPGQDYSTGGANPIPNTPTRYFRDLDENNQNVKLDWALPFHNWTEEEGQLKFGLFDSSSSRTFTDRAFVYSPNGSLAGYDNDPNKFLTPDNLGLNSITTNSRGNVRFNWNRVIQVFDSRYDGEQDIQAAYLMMDFPITKKLRVIGGARVETTDLNVHSESYLDSSVTGKKTNDTNLARTDVLPGVGLIFAATPNMNFRLNYSQTIARPTFRELAAYFSWDPTIGDFIEGNPELKMTDVNNYDARWEWFPHAGELVSFSLFYKDLKNAIERGNNDVGGEVITYFNRDTAKLYGLEVEARKNLDFLGEPLKNFSIGGNFSLIKSEVKLTDDELVSKRGFFPDVSDTRPLYDQSPYIVNLDLNYNNPRWGTTAALIFNLSGPRITITKLNANDVYEQPATALDFIISQKLWSHTTIKFAAKNLLDPLIERTYGEDSNLLYSSYRKGRAFSLSLSYDF